MILRGDIWSQDQGTLHPRTRGHFILGPGDTSLHPRARGHFILRPGDTSS